jgi:hypothetical protein
MQLSWGAVSVWRFLNEETAGLQKKKPQLAHYSRLWGMEIVVGEASMDQEDQHWGAQVLASDVVAHADLLSHLIGMNAWQEGHVGDC